MHLHHPAERSFEPEWKVVMRYLVGWMPIFAILASPLGVRAQDAEEGATPEPKLREPAPASEPATEEAALQGSTGFSSPVRFSQWFWHWHDEALKIALFSDSLPISPPSSFEGYTPGLELEETEPRVKKARIGVGASGGAFAVGIGLSLGGLAGLSASDSGGPFAAFIIGNILAVGGIAGMIASGVLLHRRKRDRDSLREAHYGTPRRAQWDLAGSRLVF